MSFRTGRQAHASLSRTGSHPRFSTRPSTLAALLLALLSIHSCSNEEAPEAPGSPRNLLLITVDTLRADRLGLYGYERPTSPSLDSFAQSATVFERAYASSSWTLPSIVSVMTGLYPETHGCVKDHTPLSTAYTTLAESLAQVGFSTGAVTSHFYLATRFGLDQGFQDFDETLVLQSRDDSHRAISSPEVLARGSSWLAQRAQDSDSKRWFLWLHFFDPHHLYLPHPEEVLEFGNSEASDLYDGEIAFTDRHIGELLATLEQLGLAQDTIVALIADHGEEFGEHGGTMHRRTLYEEVIRVPMIVRVPGLPGTRVSKPVSCVDLAPTLLELLDVGAPEMLLQGTSLAPAVRGQALQHPGYIIAALRNGPAMWDSIVEGSWKLVWDRTAKSTALYDLATDPGELQDLAEQEVPTAKRLRAKLGAAIRSTKAAGTQFERDAMLDLSQEETARIRDLGYTGGDDEE